MILLGLFWEFFKIGMFAVGGGLVTIPFIQDVADRNPEWIDPARISDMIAVSESTPGPIGINMATYAGYNAAGIPGALIATLSIITPAFLLIIFIYKFLETFSNHRFVKSAFHTLRPSVAAMIAAAGLNLFTKSAILLNGGTFVADGTAILSLPALVPFCAVLVLLRHTKIHPILYIVGGAAVGIIFKL